MAYERERLAGKVTDDTAATVKEEKRDAPESRRQEELRRNPLVVDATDEGGMIGFDLIPGEDGVGMTT